MTAKDLIEQLSKVAPDTSSSGSIAPGSGRRNGFSSC